MQQSTLDTLQTDLSTVKTTTGNVTANITITQNTLKTAREHSNDIPSLMKEVTDKLNDFDNKYTDAVKTATNPAVAPEPVVAPDVPAAAATAVVNESFEEFGKNKLKQTKTNYSKKRDSRGIFR